MKSLMISTDRNILDSSSAVSSRMAEYGSVLDELHIILFSRSGANIKKGAKIQIADNVWVYPTGSMSRLLYVSDGLKIGRRVLSDAMRGGRSSLSELRAAYENPQTTSSSWVVSCQDPFEAGLVGARLRLKFDVRLQIQIHTDFLSPFFTKGNFLNRVRARIARHTLPKADCIRAVSGRIMNSIAQDERFKLRAEISVLPIYVDKDKFERPVEQEQVQAIRERYSRYDFIVLCSGRLTAEKNFGLALKAFRDVVREHPRALLLVVGSGPEEKPLLNLAYRLGISDSVVIEPWQGDLRPYYMAANLYVLTSNYEGYSMSLVEAAASGCPLVATDVGLASQMIMEGGSGYLCPVGDGGCITKSINRMIEDSNARRGFKTSARAAAVRHLLSKEEYLRKIKELWQKC